MEKYVLLTAGLFVALFSCKNDGENAKKDAAEQNTAATTQEQTINYATKYISDTNHIGFFKDYEVVSDQETLKKLNMETVLDGMSLYGIIENSSDQDLEEIYLSDINAKRRGDKEQPYQLNGNATINLKPSSFEGELRVKEIRKVETDWTQGNLYICLYDYKLSMKETKNTFLEGTCSAEVYINEEDGSCSPATNASEFHNYLQFVGVLSTADGQEYKCIFNNDFFSVYSELPYFTAATYKKLFGEDPYELKPTEFMKTKFPNVSNYFESKK